MYPMSVPNVMPIHQQILFVFLIFAIRALMLAWLKNTDFALKAVSVLPDLVDLSTVTLSRTQTCEAVAC